MGDKERFKAASPNNVKNSWEALAYWYNNWVGQDGTELHRAVAIPAVLSLLDPKPGEKILDLGCGQGVLASYIFRAQAKYTGIDASGRLIAMARRRHGREGRFLKGDTRHVSSLDAIHEAEFDGAVFMWTLQAMEPLSSVFTSAAWALKPNGRVAIFMMHPFFRVPRQSGWGWDQGRKLVFRRIDRYLSPLAVPMREFNGTIMRDFHRPLKDYINQLASCGLVIDRMEELPSPKAPLDGPLSRAMSAAYQEIPFFLGLRARKLPAPARKFDNQARDVVKFTA